MTLGQCQQSIIKTFLPHRKNKCAVLGLRAPQVPALLLCDCNQEGDNVGVTSGVFLSDLRQLSPEQGERLAAAAPVVALV